MEDMKYGGFDECQITPTLVFLYGALRTYTNKAIIIMAFFLLYFICMLL